MGLLRNVAGKVAARVVGRLRPGEGPAPASAPSGPAVASPASSSSDGALERLDCGAQELKERLEAGEVVVIVDVRPAGRAAGDSLPGARRLPLAELPARWQELAQADEIVCACDDGRASLEAARLLRARGLINATRLEGGIAAWAAIGGPLRPAGA